MALAPLVALGTMVRGGLAGCMTKIQTKIISNWNDKWNERRSTPIFQINTINLSIAGTINLSIAVATVLYIGNR